MTRIYFMFQLPWRSYFAKTVVPSVKVSASKTGGKINTKWLQIRVGHWIHRRMKGGVLDAPNVEKQGEWVEKDRLAGVSPPRKQELSKQMFGHLSQVYLRINRQAVQFHVDLMAGTAEKAVVDKRGYRQLSFNDALKEHIAAACIYAAGLNTGKQIVWDPFCGSGTIAIEHAAISNEIPSFWTASGSADENEEDDLYYESEEDAVIKHETLSRNFFAFQRWPIFRQQKASYQGFVNSMVQKTKERTQDQRVISIGSDKNRARVEVARRNCARSGLDRACSFLEGSFEQVAKYFEKGQQNQKIAILTHPPYGSIRKKTSLHKQTKQEKQLDTSILYKDHVQDWKTRERAAWRGTAPDASAKNDISTVIQEDTVTLDTYEQFGAMLKRSPQFDPVFVLAGNPQFERYTGLKWDRVASFYNNGIKVRYEDGNADVFACTNRHFCRHVQSQGRIHIRLR